MKDWLLYLAGAIVAGGLTITVLSWYRSVRENRRGWRTSIDPHGIRYEEKREHGWESLVITATTRGHGFGELLLPSPKEWESRSPAWAQGRREEILSRVRQQVPKLPCQEKPE
jgi:hypothetical protein